MRIVILFAILFTVSCKGDLDRLLGLNKWRTYEIKEGHHSAKGIHVETLTSDHLDFKARFDGTCIYALQSRDQYDINKLYGFSDCNTGHSENSARFGWRWSVDRNKLEIFAYVHNDGNITHKYISDAEIGQEGSYSIYVVGDKYNFNFNGRLITMTRGCNSQRSVRYILYPYFGGTQKAPHNVYISIK